MPFATLQKFLDLSAHGQPVIFVDSLPNDVPGFHKLEERRAELKQLLKDKDNACR